MKLPPDHGVPPRIDPCESALNRAPWPTPNIQHPPRHTQLRLVSNNRKKSRRGASGSPTTCFATRYAAPGIVARGEPGGSAAAADHNGLAKRTKNGEETAAPRSSSSGILSSSEETSVYEEAALIKKIHKKIYK